MGECGRCGGVGVHVQVWEGAYAGDWEGQAGV